MIRRILVLSFAVAPLAACNERQEVSDPPAPVVAFTGKVEPKLVGTWKPEKGQVDMILKEDGSAETSGKVSTPGGQLDTHNKGEWLAESDSLFFRYEKPGSKTLGEPTQYRYVLKGDKLTLTRGSKNLKFVYNRDKAK